VLAAFVRKWRHRIDFLSREAVYQAHGLTCLLAALAFAPAGSAPILVLVAAQAQARFLRSVAPWVCRVPCEARVIKDLPSLEACLRALDSGPRRVLLAGELYARFHAQLAPEVRAGRLVVA
jgi:hypothetical protein